MKANIKTALYKLIPVALLNLLRHVITQFTGNTALSDPPIPLEDMTTAANQLETAIDRAVNGSQHDRALRNLLVKKVRDILTKTANYVRATANGDIGILTSSGFELAKVPERVGLPGAPQGLVIHPGVLPGSIDIRWRRERGATTYKVKRSALDPSVEANWEEVGLTSTVRFTDTDLVGLQALLVPSERHWLRR